MVFQRFLDSRTCSIHILGIVLVGAKRQCRHTRLIPAPERLKEHSLFHINSVYNLEAFCL